MSLPADESPVGCCDGTVDDVPVFTRKRQTQPVAAAARLADKKLTGKLHPKLTTSTLASKHCAKASQGVKSSSSWVPSKKLILEPCKTLSSVEVDKMVDEASAGTEPSRLTKKSLSLKSRRRQHDATAEKESEVSEDAASQLAAEPRVIVSDIKRERDWHTTSRDVLSQSVLATLETDDEETVVRETIILAASPDPVSECAAAASSCAARSTAKDYEADARRLLRQYDGTQSVDVDELFDEHNRSEVIDSQVIEIDDDDEWSQMPNQLASVRFTMRLFYVGV